MTGKILFLSTLCLSVLPLRANDADTSADSIAMQVQETSEQYLQRLTPTYLKKVSEAANWGRNWFMEVKGGASAFLGSPIGCGDVFDRLTPVLQLGVGKWFTPAVGGRVAYQGFRFKNAELKSMDYHFFHADFLFNLCSGVRCNDLGLSRWDVIPYLGVGMAYNPNWKTDDMNPDHASGNHPFAFSYGLELRYRLGNRIQLVADISGMTTAKDFVGVSPSSGFGDHMISLSAGLSISLGRVGYTRVVDAYPYMVQNDQLLLYAERLAERNSRLVAQHVEDERIKTEYRKILDIEGLLDDYQNLLAERKGESKSEAERKEKIEAERKKEHKADTELYSPPRNNYSGLNSLRARLGNRDWDGKAETMPRAIRKRGGVGGMIGDEDHRESSGYDHLNDSSTVEGYLSAMKDGMEPIGAPVFFFFRMGSDELTEVSQLLNIDVLARIARAHCLRVGITGAADSATGSERINSSLSRRRAETVRTLLMQRGVDESLITTSYEGGINDYSPVQANRHTCVTLSF